MSVYRAGVRRKPGRPLTGDEPLDQRLTVMVTASTMKRIEERVGDQVPKFVRAAIARALGGKKVGSRGRHGGGIGRKSESRKSKIRRYDE